MERIGFIGLGAMGKPMTQNLIKADYPVRVLTRTRSKIDDLLAAGAVWCDTPKEIAQRSDVVITMLPDTPDGTGGRGKDRYSPGDADYRHEHTSLIGGA
jgi:2-hydroxy-3-oxopropionate reductase